MEALARVLAVSELPSLDAPLIERSEEDSRLARCAALKSEDELKKELEACDEKIAALDETIEDLIPALRRHFDSFQDKLQVLTKDLNFIKGKSNELNQLLQENSNKLRKISPLVNDLIICPDVVRQITNDKISGSYMECISYLADKEAIYEQYKDRETPKDFDSLCEVLAFLKGVCIEKGKRFIVSCIRRLRSSTPVSSQQIQKELLEVKEVYNFISQNNLSLALELRQAYTYTIRWYYKQYFSRYIRSLTILQFMSITNQYALGQGLSNSIVNNIHGTHFLSRTFSSAPKAGQTGSDLINRYFQIDKRLSILKKEDNAVMVSQIAENNHVQNYLEIGFKNLNYAILDNCNVEFMFLNSFFRLNDNSQVVCGLLEQVFQPTFNSAMQYTEQLIANTYDIFGVLISICISQHLQYDAQRRKLPVIDDYLNGQLLILWPKFQRLVDFQCESLEHVPVSLNTQQYPGSVNNPLLAPHELTVQFSKFLTSLLLLSTYQKVLLDEKSEPLYNSITRLRKGFEAYMQKCSKKVKAPSQFLATNYMYLLNAIQQKVSLLPQEHVESEIWADTRTHINKLLEDKSNL